MIDRAQKTKGKFFSNLHFLDPPIIGQSEFHYLFPPWLALWEQRQWVSNSQKASSQREEQRVRIKSLWITKSWQCHLVSANRSGVKAVGARKNGAQHKRRGLLHASRNYKALGNTSCSISSVSTSKQKELKGGAEGNCLYNALRESPTMISVGTQLKESKKILILHLNAVYYQCSVEIRICYTNIIR